MALDHVKGTEMTGVNHENRMEVARVAFAIFFQFRAAGLTNEEILHGLIAVATDRAIKEFGLPAARQYFAGVALALDEETDPDLQTVQ